MISLQIKPYCENCPDFEPDVTKMRTGGLVVQTIINCEHRERCERIHKHIKLNSNRKGE